MSHFPKYMRISLTEKCPMNCTFCHNEGWNENFVTQKISPDDWFKIISTGIENGVRKLKFVGGEPLLYPQLPKLISMVREKYPDLDISLITSGSLPVRKLQACFEAGLSRANLSIHGWSWAFFQKNSKNRKHFQYRQENIKWLLQHGTPVKLNYVYSSPAVESDLQELLEAMKFHNVTVNVLDDLSNPNITPQYLVERLIALQGEPAFRFEDPDSNSLSTLHLYWSDGLVVEIKDQQLSKIAPWKSCQTCPKKSQCTEGIHAIRVHTDGDLKLCMDRPDISFPLHEHLENPRLDAIFQQFILENLKQEEAQCIL